MYAVLMEMVWPNENEEDWKLILQRAVGFVKPFIFALNGLQARGYIPELFMCTPYGEL